METSAFRGESSFAAGSPAEFKIVNPADSGISMTLFDTSRGEWGEIAPGSWLGVPGAAGFASVTWLERPVPRQPFLRRLRLALRMVFSGR